MNFRTFYDTRRMRTPAMAAEMLGMNKTDFGGDDLVILFDGTSAFMTRKGASSYFWAPVGRDEFLASDPEWVARHVYFDHYVFECLAHDEPCLVGFYDEWLTWQELPAACALELQAGADLTPYQREWLEGFSGLWERVVEGKTVTA